MLSGYGLPSFIGFLVSLSLVLFQESAYSSGPLRVVGRDANVEPRVLIDFPTAGVMPKAGLSSGVEFFQDGGLLVTLSFGVFDRLSIGVSYGGSYVLGSGKPTFNKAPGGSIKWRLFDETAQSFALAVGFDSQGKESYIDSINRYTVKSPGFFIVASKNYSFLGYLSIHGGINYSLERDDGDKDPNGFIGIEKTLGPAMSLIAEYNLATNDDNERALGTGHGYLNVGWRWALAEGFAIGFDLTNLGKNRPQEAFANRVLRLEYVRSF